MALFDFRTYMPEPEGVQFHPTSFSLQPTLNLQPYEKLEMDFHLLLA